MMKITESKLKQLQKMTRDERRIVTKAEFGYFLVHYFPHYIQYRFAPFHYEMMQDSVDLIEGKIKELCWIQFRESSKTTFAKILLLYLICFELDEYINVDSYDKENAERILYDIVWELQTNKRIIDDFGQIYNIGRSKDQITQKRISNFVTNPTLDKDGNILKLGIRVEAHSTQEPVRGRLHGAKRPGFIILDDFENYKTIKSEEYTKNIREHIQEFKGGLDSTRGRVLYLANYLSEFANVQSIIERSRIDSNLRVRIVPIKDEIGPTWSEKYVENEEDGKVSIEAIRKRMWTPETGDDDFMAEMMCRPVDYSNAKFKKEWIENNRYYPQDLEGKTLNRFITIDNALSVKTEADFIGINVVDVDKDNIWYSIYVKRLKLNSPDLVDEIFRLYNTYKPKVMGVEQKAFEDLIEPYIKRKAKELAIAPYVIGLKDKGIRKEDRIEGRLLGRFKLGMIKLKKYATDDTNELVKELAHFPNGKHDDLCLVGQTKIATQYGNKNIENMKSGELVITPLGLKKVIASEMTGLKEVVSWNGLIGTRNHPVYVDNKFVRLDALRYTNRYKTNKLCLSTQIQWMLRKVWYSMELPIKEWEGKESIISLNSVPMKNGGNLLKVFMSLFGNILQERNAVKTSTFIIKTAIHLTMTLLTWSVYWLGNITQCLKKETWRQLGRIWNELGRWQVLGIKVGKVWNGIKSMVKNLGLIEKRRDSFVCGVVKSSGVGLLRLDSVNHLMPVIIGEKITQKSGEQFKDEEILKQNLKEKVYNLTVEDAHCYYANGILVGNCDSLQYMHDIAYAPGQDAPQQPVTMQGIKQADIKRVFSAYEKERVSGDDETI